MLKRADVEADFRVADDLLGESLVFANDSPAIVALIAQFEELRRQSEIQGAGLPFIFDADCYLAFRERVAQLTAHSLEPEKQPVILSLPTAIILDVDSSVITSSHYAEIVSLRYNSTAEYPREFGRFVKFNDILTPIVSLLQAHNPPCAGHIISRRLPGLPLTLPSEAPEMYQGAEASGDPVQFMRRVWGRHIEAGILSHDDIVRLDEELAKVIFFRGAESGDPVEFMRRIWGRYIDEGSIYQADLRRLDRKLVRAVESYAQARKSSPTKFLPPAGHAYLERMTAEERLALIRRQKRDSATKRRLRKKAPQPG